MTPEPIRDLRATDEEAVRGWLRAYLTQHLAWWQDAYGHPPASSLDDLVEREWQDLRASAAGGGFVAVLGDADPLGVVQAGVRPERYLGFPVGVLSWISVTPEARGHGSTDALMHAAHAWMDARGARGREVFVTAANAPAVRLYARQGYRVIDHRLLG